MIRLASLSDIEGIVEVHKASFSTHHFTSFLSRKLLNIYYQYFMNEPNYTYVLEDDSNEILGFIVIGFDIPEKIKQFKQENYSSIVMTAFLNPIPAIQKVISSFYFKLFDKSSSYKDSSFLLLSIATLPNTKGKGKELMQFIDDFMKEKSTSSIGLYVRVQNLGAINFYLNHQYSIKGYSNAQYYMEKNIIK